MRYIPEVSKWIAYGSVVNSDSDASPQSYSNNGINWNQFNLSSIFHDYDVDYIPAAPAGLKWVAYGKKTNQFVIAYSSDGVNWNAPNPQSNSSTIFGTINCVAYGASMWVAVGTNSNDEAIVAHSSDGITWTAGNIPIGVFNSIYDVAYNAERWVMSGDGAYGFKCIATLTDGMQWNVANHPANYIHNVNVLLYNSNMSIWIAAGYNDDNSNSGPILKSSNGNDWTPVNINISAVDGGVSYSDKMVVWGYGPSNLSNAIIATLTDGITWTIADVSSIFDRVIDVAYNLELSKWVAVGVMIYNPFSDAKFNSRITSIIAHSDNGVIWTLATTPDPPVLFNEDKTTLVSFPIGKGGSYEIPNSVTSIGDYAFAGCTGLTSVTIPSSVTSIGYWAFVGCTGLTSITVDAQNANYSSNDGVVFNKYQTTLVLFPIGKGGSYTIPSSVTIIGESAFDSCTGLTSVTIPVRVASIGDDAFHGCTGLTSVSIPISVTSIGSNAFRDSRLTTVTIADGQTISTIRFNPPNDNPPGVLFFGRTVKTLLAPAPQVRLNWVSVDANYIISINYTSDAEYIDVVLERYLQGNYRDNVGFGRPEKEAFNITPGTNTVTLGHTNQAIPGWQFCLFIQSRSFRSDGLISGRN